MTESTPSFHEPSDSLKSTLHHMDLILKRRAALDAALSGTMDAAMAAVERESDNWAPTTLLALYEMFRGLPNGGSTRYAQAVGVPINTFTVWKRGGPPDRQCGRTYEGVFPIEYQLVPRRGLPTVYLLLRDQEVVYVGKSMNVKGRLRTHWREGAKNIDAWQTIGCSSEAEALQLEGDLIFQHQPMYNVQGRGRRAWVRAS